MKPLTKEEENVVKDILKVIGNDETLNKQFATACGLAEVEFDSIADSVFRKLGNGRLIVAS